MLGFEHKSLETSLEAADTSVRATVLVRETK